MKRKLKHPTKRTPRSLIVLLLLAFPPLAWFFMMIDKTYHHWLVKVIFISGIISLSFITLMYLTIGIQLKELYTTLGLGNAVNQEIMLITMWAGMLFALLQIIFAVYCHHYLKHHGKLHKTQLVTIALILVSAFVVALIPPVLIAQAIYILNSSI